jgi:alkylation response protein AidB-like acyl-CoA dehydrogenase
LVSSTRPGDSVTLRADVDPDLRTLSGRARGARGDLEQALALARDLGAELPAPATGGTLRLWESLATLGAADLTVARVVEPHLDALAILREAGQADLPAGAVWGVFAAEGGGGRLGAEQLDDGGWTLSGPKPWCSLGDRLTHALVTAWVDESRRGLFLVDLDHDGVRHLSGQTPWAARGLVQVRSTGLEFDAVPAVAVGAPGWYLERPGFAWGGIGVAAVWYGGAVAVARRLREASTEREPDQIALAHLGAVDVALARARALLVDAASIVDGPRVSPEDAALLALRTRQVVADSVDEVILRVGHALGPGPLATEGEHAGRVSDLTLYVRQHHAERDAATLGRSVLSDKGDGGWTWW